jgi:hypothetical protein
MKKLFTLTPLFFLFMSISIVGVSQCKHFAKQVCKKDLAPYIHNGNYNAAILTEGETAEMYKTFYAKQNYRVYICGSSSMPRIHFQVLDVNRNVLYDNKNNGFKMVWDFIPEASQQLIISLKVTGNDSVNSEPSSGCVAIMIGIKEQSGNSG